MRYIEREKISLFVLNKLHHITLLENGKLYFDYELKWDEFLNPLLFYIYKLYDYKFDKKIDTLPHDNTYMNQIERFAQERNLKVEWFIEGKCIN